MHSRLLKTEAFRQAALHAVILAGAMAVLITVVFFILDHSLRANLLQEVDGDLSAIRTAYITAGRRDPRREAKEFVSDRMLAPDSSNAFLLQHAGVRLAGNIPPMPARTGVFVLRLAAPGQSRAVEMLGRGVAMPGGDYAFVGRDIAIVRSTESDVLIAFALVLLGGLALALLSGLLISRGLLKRAGAVTRTCRAIVMGKLGERIPSTGRDGEFDRLSDAINSMLDRIQVLMESLRQVSTDIAHDLRTPLTHLRHTLERVRNESPSDSSQAVDAAIAECDGLLSIFTALLRIAQIEAGTRRSEFHRIELEQLIEQAREIYAPVMEDSGHVLTLQCCKTLPIRGDAQLLLQALSNLLGNAITHTPPGTEIVLGLESVGQRPVVTVADRGPGIPQQERPKVLRRFYRCEQSRTAEGSGLGLSLVAAVADLHEARLVLADNAPGLKVTLEFPPTA